MKAVFTLLGAFLVLSCSSIFRPYPCGPVLDKEGIHVFKRQNEFLGLKPGVVFADIGASSGYYDAAMAVFLDSVTFYLNDIDYHCLNERNLNKVLRYYSRLRGSSIQTTNSFRYIIGTPTQTNLPENTFDVIFSNATMHVIGELDSMLTDLHRNLKPDGSLYIRDEFVYNGELKKCGSKTCGHYVLQYEPFLQRMNNNGFVLNGESHEFGYPIYKFSKGLVRQNSSN
ncbi:MAG TPA: methyltransferase domain-containing protein [Saprospiraceae bacterium]|nr:methyltransferase domain-containing protein [Saprospiraceae bacterium]